jgi:hypothetical protein
MKLDPALEAAVIEGYNDPAFWCRFFLPHWFPTTMPWLHLGILAILTRRVDFLQKYKDLDKIIQYFTYKKNPNDPNSEVVPIFRLENNVLKMEISRFTLIMMPRGFSKTTLVNAVNLFLICYADTDFMFYLSETATHSETQIRNIKRELEYNEKLLSAFGNLKGDIWRQDLFKTSNDVTVGCAGRGGQVRGKNEGGKRPSRIILDDVEDKESVATADQLAKTRTWFFSDVLPMLPKMKEDAQIVALGTMLANNALLATLIDDPEWTSVKFGALLPDGNPLWPEMMSLEKIAREKATYARNGMLNSFYMEYLSTARNTEDQKFPKRYFKYNSAPLPSRNAIAIDPAISEKPTSDMSAIAVVGMQPNGKIIVHEMIGKVGMLPREQIDTFFKLHKEYNCIRQGVESIAYQAALIHMMREEMFRKKHYMSEITPITHKRANKILRVESILHPRFANGYIEFAKVFPELEEQLEDWPNGRKDLPDALAMGICLLDSFAAQAADPDKNLADDEYDDIEKVLGKLA